jgi:beta-glucosidase
MFTDGFLWGAATAAYQIEGAADVDGRGESIWDTFCRAGGAFHGDTGDIAADHYGRLDEDLDLMASLGLKAYRFSIAWPRVQANGRGAPNQRGLDFYRRLADGLRSRGIVPMATLYHFDLPTALEDEGGWTARDTAERFAQFASLVAGALAADVDKWITLNEPWAAAWFGYGNGSFAPGRASFDDALAATHHLLLAHGLAVPAVRAAAPASEVGVTLGLCPIRTLDEDPSDVRAARMVDASVNRLFLDPIMLGRYPEELLGHYADNSRGLGCIRPDDLAVIAAPLDFLGVNYYLPRTVVSQATIARHGGPPPGTARSSFYRADDIEAHLGAVEVCPVDLATTAMDWAIDPSGLTEVLLRLQWEYPPIPVYITENGAAYHDYVDPNGGVDDFERIAYLEGHIRAVEAAVAAGADVRGYFVWSLLDNFEWTHGFSRRFGLVFVEYGSQRRIPKASSRWYRQVIADNGNTNGG